MRRLHTEFLIRASSDLAGENILGRFDEEQDSDNLLWTTGPEDMTVPAAAAATQIQFPIGATKLRFIAIMKVSALAGVNVIFNNPANDPILVSPPTGTGMEGQFFMTTNATALYVSNPSTTAEVSFSIMTGYAAT